jgi:hypothetical protein
MTSADLTPEEARRGVLHPEVVGNRFEGARREDGMPLIHAEGTSRPIRARIPRELPPRGAHEHGNRPIDQAEAAERFAGIQDAYEHPCFRTAHYAVFHTGPSATGDIEGVLIHGAQGVRSLTVVLTG